MPISIGLLTIQGTPDDGVSEVQRITPSGTISGGTFTLTYDGEETDPIDWDATAAEVEAAVEALANVGSGNVVGSGGPLPGAFVAITFAGALAGLPVPELVVDDGNLTGAGATLTVTTTTAGVQGSYRGAPAGTLLSDELNAALLINQGSANVPQWADYAEGDA